MCKYSRECGEESQSCVCETELCPKFEYFEGEDLKQYKISLEKRLLKGYVRKQSDR